MFDYIRNLNLGQIIMNKVEYWNILSNLRKINKIIKSGGNHSNNKGDNNKFLKCSHKIIQSNKHKRANISIKILVNNKNQAVKYLQKLNQQIKIKKGFKNKQIEQKINQLTLFNWNKWNKVILFNKK